MGLRSTSSGPRSVACSPSMQRTRKLRADAASSAIDSRPATPATGIITLSSKRLPDWPHMVTVRSLPRTRATPIVNDSTMTGFTLPRLTPDCILDLPGITLEFLAHPDGRCVLQVRPAGLDHRPELLALRLQRSLQQLQRGDQLVGDGDC